MLDKGKPCIPEKEYIVESYDAVDEEDLSML